jgi:hypothetical protein
MGACITLRQDDATGRGFILHVLFKSGLNFLPAVGVLTFIDRASGRKD